jgi:hypothetical protein
VNVTLSGCSVVNATPTVQPEPALNATRSFAKDETQAEAFYKKNGMTLTGKAEAVADNKITLAGYTDPKGKSPPQKAIASFSPELSLSNCWLVPR